MPYRRRSTFRRKKTKTSKSWYDKKYSTLQLAHKAFQGVRYLKGLVNSEMLHVITKGAATYNWVGGVALLSSIAQNDTDSGRTGNSVLGRNLLVRFNAFRNTSATDVTMITVIIFMDTQQIADTTPALTDILEETATFYVPMSNIKDASSGRFKILKRWYITLDSTHTSTHREAYFKIYEHLRWNGTANTDTQKNHFYIGIVSDEETNSPQVNHYARFGYHDN